MEKSNRSVDLLLSSGLYCRLGQCCFISAIGSRLWVFSVCQDSQFLSRSPNFNLLFGQDFIPDEHLGQNGFCILCRQTPLNNDTTMAYHQDRENNTTLSFPQACRGGGLLTVKYNTHNLINNNFYTS